MSAPSIAVVDYGAGNLRSVAKALLRTGARVDVSGDPSVVLRADGVVLPGVGAFADAVKSLAEKNLDAALRELLARGTPYLGLCLGLQLLFDESEEHGVSPGLGVFPGRVERFPPRAPDGSPRAVPHIGWNEVRWRGSHPLLAGLDAADCYYFVHAYRAVPAESGSVVGTADYPDPFAAAVARENVFAVQFHPEKSQSAGARLLDAFVAWVPRCG